MDTQELQLAPDDSPDIETLKRADAPAIWDDYRSKLEKLRATAETLTLEDTKSKQGLAIVRATRLSFKSLRVEVEHRRKELGEEALRRKQKIDVAAKEIIGLIEPFETRMLELEKSEERAEAERKLSLAKTRGEEISAFGANLAAYPALGDMPEDDFQILRSALKAAHQAKTDAAAKAEHERLLKEIAESEERERIKLENERLKKEAEEKAAALLAEREVAERERQEAAKRAQAEKDAMEAAAAADREKAAEALRIAQAKAAAELARKEAEAQERAAKARAEAKAEREKIEAEAKAREAKALKERQAAEAKEHAALEKAKALAREEREAREKIEAEIAAKNAQEQAAKLAEEKARADAAKAPDREKLMALAARVLALDLPQVTTEEGLLAMGEISEQVGKFALYIEKKAGAL